MTSRFGRLATVSSLLLVAALAIPCVSWAAGSCACPDVTRPFPSSPPNEVVQIFELDGKMHTAWKVRYAHGSSRGLYITGAWFRPGPGKPWMKVLDDLRIAEVFVPYHPGSPRYYDLTQFNFPMIPATPGDLGCCGEILDGVVIKEIRNRGLVWKDDTRAHRGSSLVLWAGLDAANYNYLFEYTFRDDGVIEFAIGATARNLPGAESVPHMHLGLWRIDVDINGAADDRVSLVRHVESTSGPSATDDISSFNGGVEGFADWVADEFTTLRIEDTNTTNGRGSTTAWDLMLVRYGSSRHQEGFTQHDFWVTRYAAGETDYTQIESYIDGDSIDGTDIVVWSQAPIHHLPRDEDGIQVGGSFVGSALVMWSKSYLKPRNVFDRTPFFRY